MNIRGHLFILLILGYSFTCIAQDVSARLTVPAEATAGETVEVSIEISKGTLTNFGRIQQTFPGTVQIEPKEMAGADFSYTEGKLNIIWLNLPAASSIRIRYNLTTSSEQQGELTVNGKFSYIMSNDRKEINLGPKTILIRSASGTNRTTTVDQARTDPASAIQAIEGMGIAAFREAPYLSSASDGWEVNILVSRGDVEKLARVEETIPAGYAAEQIDGKNSIFTFKGGVAKFLWMKMPTDPYFMVSYKVIPTSGTSVQVPDIKGVFAYMKNDEVKSISIINSDDPLHTMHSSQLAAVLTRHFEGTGAERPVIASIPAERPETQAPTATQPVSVPLSKTVIRPSYPDQDGLVFRVQLLATSNPSQARSYFADFNLGEVYTEQHQGLYKYTTGNFKRMEDASAHGQKIASETGIKGFVTAFYNNQRITLDEARRIRDRQ